MKLKGYSRRVDVGVRRDRLLVSTLRIIRDIKSYEVGSFGARKSLVKRMVRNQRLIKRYSDEIYEQYSGKEHIEVYSEI